jgi:hypothetical protein
MVEAVHRYVADQIIDSLLPLALAEHSRLESQVRRAQDNLKAIDRQQSEFQSFRKEGEELQTRAGQLGNRLRDRVFSEAQQNGTSKDFPEAAAILLKDIETLQIISVPLQQAQTRWQEARLDRDKADLQAELTKWSLELERWKRPAIARLAVPGAGPFLSSLPSFFVLWATAMGLLAFALISVFSWRRHLIARRINAQ